MSSPNLNSDNNNTEPTLCSNGCDFYGTAATHGLCSKCYNDFLKSFIQTPLSSNALSPKATPNSSSDFDSVSSLTDDFNQKITLSTGSVAPKKKNRCGKCNKKVGLTGFQCRCGNMFCGSHRYAEEHDCDFDFKAKGRSDLAKANPLVKADKLDRL